MARIFWIFLIFSFLGYLLEKGFAWYTGAEKQVRKAFLLLPLCPVYGLGMLAVWALPGWVKSEFWTLFFFGGMAATAVEYIVHWFYEAVFDVKFWDYTGVALSVKGRVCLPFALIWGFLVYAAATYFLPGTVALAETLPPWLTFAALILFAADAVTSASLLWHGRDTELLSLRTVYNRLT